VLISDTQKKVLTLLADGEFHSGTSLADTLGISRSAVWKQISALSQLGLQHSAVSGKGYRLDKALDLLEHAKIDAALNDQTRALITLLEIHDQIDSTNSHLVERSQQQAESGTICFAEHQTAGKGRRGRQWVSPFGSNIYLSILWRFEKHGPAAIAGLSLIIGVTVIRALKQHNIDNIGLKWPNDIISEGKKLGGILIEVSGEAEGPCTAVIGLGLNLFLPETADIDQAWTDLSKMNPADGNEQKTLYRNELAATLLNHMLPVIAEFESTGLKAYLDEWRSYDCLKDKAATLFIARQQIDGIVAGIDNSGQLLIKRPDGVIQAFASGEISFNPSAL